MAGQLARVGAFMVCSALALGASMGEAQAQACPAGRTCYYIPPAASTPPGYSGVDWDMVLASSFGTVTGTYKIGNAPAVAFSITPATPQIIDLGPTQGVVNAYSTPEQRGIFIQSSSEALSVTRRLIAGPWQSSISVKDSARSLGQRFRLGGYSLNALNTPDTGFDMVSIYAPTGGTITIKAPPGVALPFWEGVAGDTVSVSLAAGETYLQRVRIPSPNSCAFDITGALLTSDRPVSVTTGGRGWAGSSGLTGACSNNGGCGDDGEDHILPTSQLGTEYVISQYNSDGSRRVMVVADEDDTVVTINGTQAATLAAGRYHEFREGGVTRITTSKPAYVYQNAGLSTCELDLAFIPPLSFGSRATNTSAVNVSGTGAARMLIEASQVGTIRVDGAALNNPTILMVPGRADLRVVSFSLAGGTRVVSATGDFQLGVATATGGTGLFAYYNIFRVPGCGDGVVSGLEGCDDGNTDSGDGCSSACKIELGGMGCDADTDCANAFCAPNGTCVACVINAHCDDNNTCTNDACQSNTCSNTPAAAGAACAGGVCNGDMNAPACVTCVDTQPGLGQDAGCPAGSPACTTGMNGPRCVGCLLNANCDDNNPCTTDTCALGGACAYAPVAAGTTCNNGAGVCNGSANSPACQACVDDSVAGQDTGCTAQRPFCDRTGAQPVCVACVSDAQCMAGQLCDATGTCVAAAVAITAPTHGAALDAGATTLTGTANAGELVTVQLTDSMGNVVRGATVVASGGAWSLDVMGLMDGAYTVTASVAANGGAVNATPVTFTVDTVAPSVSLTTPADGALTNDSTPTASGQAADAALDAVFIEVLDAQGMLAAQAAVMVDAMGGYSVDLSMLADGVYTITATATDDAGNATTTLAHTFRVDTTAPVISIAQPADGGVTAEVRPELSGMSEPGAAVVVEVRDAQGMVIATLMAIADPATGAWSGMLNMDLASGSYTLSATALDAAGNTSQPVTSSFTIDTDAPALDLVAPAAGEAVASAQPAISGTSAPGQIVTIVITDANGAVVETLTTVADAVGLWSTTPTVMLADGAYTATASAQSAAGVTAMDSAMFVVDTRAPDVAITAPGAGEVVMTGQPAISGTGEPGATITVVIDGMTVGTAVVDQSGMWTFTPPTPLADGPHSITVNATDAAGNSGMASVDITVTTVVDPDMGMGDMGGDMGVDMAPDMDADMPADMMVADMDVDMDVTGDMGQDMSQPDMSGADQGDDSGLILAGGCAQGAGGAAGSSLWLAALGLLAMRRRRRA